jgi:hypothetical protein
LLISLGARASDATPQRIETTFPDFVTWLYQHPRIQADLSVAEYVRLKTFPTKSPEGQRIHDDKDGAYVCLADFGGNRRAYETLLHSSGVPLDFDAGWITADTIRATLHGFQYVAFSTYAHQPGAERWRVFVPSARPMTADEHTAAWFELSGAFGNAADPAAKDATRLSYLPGRCLLPGAAAIFHSLNGSLFQPIPVAPAAPAVLQTQAGPVPGWAGPTDDVELLTIACNTRTRPDERFGGPIHFAMLWGAFEPWLSQQFPPGPSEEGQPWSRTQADMALAGELIYYTGGDVERSIQLLRQSGLASIRNGDDDWHERKARLAVERAAANAKMYHFMKSGAQEPGPMAPTAPVPAGTTAPAPPPPDLGVVQTTLANIPMGHQPTLNDYYAYLPDHTYIHRPSGERISSASVDEQIGKEARQILVPTVPVHKYTWAPGLPERFLLSELDDTYANGDRVWLYNDYRAPKPHVHAGDVSRWVSLVHRLYPEDAEHLISYFADAVQHPERKCNHAVVLGSSIHGIGKDTLLAPVAYAVGRNNFRAIKPTALASDFNPWVRAVIVQISESRDLGEGFNSLSRYEFYERCKDLAAAPPATLECNDKHVKQHPVANVLRLVITTNHLTDGLHIDPKDRRHHCAWSDAQAMSEDDAKALWDWYETQGGLQHVSHYLTTLDLVARGWNHAAPPRRTAWWHTLTAAGGSAEEERFADALEKLQRPEWLTIPALAEAGGPELAGWMAQPGNRRKVEREMGKIGYQRLPNPTEMRGRWYVGTGRAVVYRRADVPAAQLLSKFTP